MILRGRCKYCDITYKTEAEFKPIRVTSDLDEDPIEVLPGRLFVILCRCNKLVNLTPISTKREGRQNKSPRK